MQGREAGTVYDLRLAGIIDRQDQQPGKPAFEFSMDFLDVSYRVKECMPRSDMASLGWAIERHHPYGILISKDRGLCDLWTIGERFRSKLLQPLSRPRS